MSERVKVATKLRPLIEKEMANGNGNGLLAVGFCWMAGGDVCCGESEYVKAFEFVNKHSD